MDIKDVSIRNLSLYDVILAMPDNPFSKDPSRFASVVSEVESNSALETYLKFLIRHLSGRNPT